MNEEYLQGLHGHLGVKADYNTWINNIKGNEDYLQGLHNHIGVKADYSVWKDNVFGAVEKVPEVDGKINFSELDKRNDMSLRPERYDIDGNLKPKFEVYTDSEGIGHSKYKSRKPTDTSVDTDFIYRFNKTKDKAKQFLKMYNTVNEGHQEVQDLLKSRFEAGAYDAASFEEISFEDIQDVVNLVQKQKYQDIKSDMNDAEVDDMLRHLNKKYNLNVTKDGGISLPEVVVKEEFVETEKTPIGVKRAKEVQRMLSSVDIDHEEVKQEIAKNYFSLDAMPERELKPYSEGDYREFANTEEED